MKEQTQANVNTGLLGFIAYQSYKTHSAMEQQNAMFRRNQDLGVMLSKYPELSRVRAEQWLNYYYLWALGPAKPREKTAAHIYGTPAFVLGCIAMIPLVVWAGWVGTGTGFLWVLGSWAVLFVTWVAVVLDREKKAKLIPEPDWPELPAYNPRIYDEYIDNPVVTYYVDPPSIEESK